MEILNFVEVDDDTMPYILFDPEGKSYLITNVTKDFHTKDGFVKSSDLCDDSVGSVILSSMGKPFYLIKATDSDIFSRLKRKPQAIMRKDLGFILANSFVGKDSVCIDCGTGSGFCSIFLARHTKKVYSIDVNFENTTIAKNNAKRMNLDNITFLNFDFQTPVDDDSVIPEKVDLTVLDIPKPWEAVDNVIKFLSVGGFLISYSPSVNQVSQMNARLAGSGKFIVLKNSQLVEFPWRIKGQVQRPESSILLHTAFLTVARRVLE